MHDTTPTTALGDGRFRSLPSVAMLALILALAGCKGGGDGADKKGKDGADKGPEAVPVEVATASRRSIAASYNGTAALEARGEAQVVAKTSGIALQVYAEVGQQVRAGQTLVRIDADRATLQVAQSDAQVRKLQANFARAQQLASQKMVSANDLDTLRYDLENARASNRLARLELSYTTVKAPISGVIAERSIKPG
ncbi:MAG: efflux RND transporter periplasmic adaptor subunit, partial [Thermomonas sp.]